MNFEKINIEDLEFSPFKKVGKEWMLVTAGDKEKCNTMTASWGSMGKLWNKDVTFIFIRPQRYTMKFLESNEYYSLSFFEECYRKSLTICGRNSGRDIDKIKLANLTPVFVDKAPFFQETNLVIICKKIYSDFINPELFIDKNLDSNYPNKDYHKMFIGEVVSCLKKVK